MFVPVQLFCHALCDYILFLYTFTRTLACETVSDL